MARRPGIDIKTKAQPPNAPAGKSYRLVAWVTDALDKVRRAVWNTARGGRGGRNEASKTLKDAGWALWKNPPNLTDKQKATLATNRPLYRAYLLKEQFREIIAVEGADGNRAFVLAARCAVMPM